MTSRQIASQFYKEFRDKILINIFKRRIIRPWMKYKEISIIEDILKFFDPKKCLEWGTGYSTIYFQKFINNDSKWLSIEHDSDWAQSIRSINNNHNVEIINVEPNHFPWSDEYGDGSYSDLKDYIKFPKNRGPFDFILIDGRARKFCLIESYNLITSLGIVIMHDANRKRYHDIYNLFENNVLFKDHRVSGGGLWIGNKSNLNFCELLNKHKKIWESHDKIYRYLPKRLGKLIGY